MESIVATTEDTVGWITFNRPEKHNAISLSMWDGLADTLDRWSSDNAVRAVVLTGAGDRAFMAGADIGEFEKERDNSAAYAEYERRAARGRAALAEFSKPLIAAVNGYCIGAGLGIAMACDLCIAADTASFAMPGSKLGMPCDLATGRKLVSIVGPLNARMILFAGDRIPAAEALRIGLVNGLAPRDKLKMEASRLAGSIADNAPLAIFALKRIVDASLQPLTADTVQSIRRHVLACVDSDDYRAGRAAVLRKVKPDFHGR